jgi:hypothetical protein
VKAPTPEPEHRWLQQLVGEWTYEMECEMKPGDPPVKFTGTESVRAIGELWTQGEGRGTAPDGTPATSLLTLGYDPEKKKFVGTWLGSMMTFLWTYEGRLEGNVLTLDTTGPNFDAPGMMARYQERIDLVNSDYRTFTSRQQAPDGSWKELMTMHYRRVK